MILAEGCEVAELAMGARLGLGLLVRARARQQRVELAAQSVPVRANLLGVQRLEPARAEPQVHLLRCDAGGRLDGIGVEAELQHVTGFRLRTRELGVDRLVGDRPGPGVLDAQEEVGDPPDAVVHERQLVDHVVACDEHPAQAVDPRCERLPLGASRYLEHRPPAAAVLLEAVLLVPEPLLHQELGERTERLSIHHERAVLDPVLERQRVRAVQPGGDLRGCEQSFGHRSGHSSGSRRRGIDTWPPQLWIAAHRTGGL
jgi:hypothetical protein